MEVDSKNAKSTSSKGGDKKEEEDDNENASSTSGNGGAAGGEYIRCKKQVSSKPGKKPRLMNFFARSPYDDEDDSITIGTGGASGSEDPTKRPTFRQGEHHLRNLFARFPYDDEDDSSTTGSGGASGSEDPTKRPTLRQGKHRLINFFPMYDDENFDPIEMRHLMLKMSGYPWGDPYLGMNRHSRRSPQEYEQSPYKIKSRKQEDWYPPKMVLPEEKEEQEQECLTEEDHGELDTDAQLFFVKEKNDDGEKIHSVLHMPSYIPDKLKLGNQDALHSSRTYNIIMVDVSASMFEYWKSLVQHWNEHVASTLVGRTNIFLFGTEVELKRSGTFLEKNDLDRGSTDLTGALQTIVNELYGCKEKYIKVFLITDGHHNATSVQPDRVIQYMKAATGKICDVYVLGLGSEFPVKYSIDIRSHLHNGSSNLPTLFWAQSASNIEEKMRAIAHEISSKTSQSLKLSVTGSFLPGVDTTDRFHLKEWVYFSSGPDQIKEMTLIFGRHKGHITLKPCKMPVTVLSEVVRQWNNVIIQRHSKREFIPPDVLPFMEQLFETQMMELKETSGPLSIHQRLERKEMKTHETEFRTLFNKIKVILTTEKFQNEIELAENILSITVGGGKYITKVLQMKGHTDEDYEKDIHEFMEVYNKYKANFQNIIIAPEDCCWLTLASTLSDLQDPDFPKLMDQSKFEFLKDFTITGIPVFAPARDSVSINPWSLSIRGILKEPKSIMSQTALNAAAESNPPGQKNKDLYINPDDSNTCCNAIVPVFPPYAAKTVAPFVYTRFYAMCATFAILKNPHIIDFNIHMAALGVTWVRLLFEYPTEPRSEFVHHRIESIEATAALYINRPSYTKYWEVLRDDTAQALMTESTLQVDNRTLKCESLIKPMFILHIKQRCENPIDPNVLAKILRMMLIEYIGRCLSNYKVKENESTPFTDFFAETLADQEKKKEWVEKYVNDSKAALEGSENLLLEDFYTLERVQKAARKTAVEAVKSLKEQLTAQIPIGVNMEKVERLRNVSGAGDVSWLTLKTYAREVGLTEDVVSDLFSEQSTFVYVTHALMHRSSRDRLKATISDYDASWKLVTRQVQEENSQILSKDLKAKFIEHLQCSWLQAYSAAHSEVVQPMTRQEILREATQLGVEVTDTTFDQVYKRYRPQLGLLSNACQCRACPYFLIPDKRYNQHASVERHGPAAFPHALHHTAYHHRDSDVPTVISQVVAGAYTRNQTPVPQEAVQNITSDLQNLQKIYKEIAM